MPPTIDLEKCTGCGVCVDNCLADLDVLTILDGKAGVKDADECIECGTCIEFCDEKAITLDTLEL